jgi:hypothetical protein
VHFVLIKNAYFTPVHPFSTAFGAIFDEGFHQEWMEKGDLGGRAARMAVSQKLGHNRINVVGSYIPQG